MASTSNKKMLILYTLKVLKEYSDEAHPLRQEEIADKIYSLYGMECERKAIAANLQCLEDFGYDIVRVKKHGVYLGEREFEKSEISFLVDAVFSSKIIDSNNSKQLAKKIYSFLSQNDRKQFKYIYKADQLAKTDNKQLFLNIDIINEAIEYGKKIEFSYSYNGVDGKKNFKRYSASPYFLINSQSKYYMVCCRFEKWGIANYKLDRMTEVKILDEPAIKINNIVGYENGLDIANYTNENIYMFGGKSVSAKLKLDNEHTINYLYDWFSDVNVFTSEGEIFANVKANERALIYWALQYGENIELIEPLSTREEIKQVIDNLNKKYNN